MAKLIARAVALLALCIGTPVFATAIYQIQSYGPSPSSFYQFNVSSDPTGARVDPTSFTLTNVKTKAYDSVTGFYSYNADYTFFTSAAGGGYLMGGERVSGDQLFTGQTTMPTFKLGEFDLFNGSFQRTVDISFVRNLPGVPEPASWATMVAGFGVVASSLRRRARAIAA